MKVRGNQHISQDQQVSVHWSSDIGAACLQIRSMFVRHIILGQLETKRKFFPDSGELPNINLSKVNAVHYICHAVAPFDEGVKLLW